ncbi:class II aldolase/adducin family protein [Salinispora arenicola]|uniref:class II aldolase/adducin family protein n=1 Tax=Salinispora arenicola TaxID=168697 RepID=UPI0027DDDD80|nr:class II aldolase/adducin family protein [Salinispora arenicola]
MTGGRPTRTVEEERTYRKQRLAASFRIFARLGFDEGAGGHITPATRATPHQFWINPFTVPFARIRGQRPDSWLTPTATCCRERAR